MKPKTTTRQLFLACKDQPKCAFKGKADIRPAQDVMLDASLYIQQGGRCFCCGQPRAEAELRYVTIGQPAAVSA